jgi:hypothetical protein
MINYTSSEWERLRHKFPGSEKIHTNFSQAHQDMFVLTMLDGKRNGTFLEIGAFDAKFISNTFLLEREFGWNGISIDIEESAKQSFILNGRSSEFILHDALKLDYSDILTSRFPEKRIDYLMIDIEPTEKSLECLKMMPLEDFRFSVITYETDFYDTNTSAELKEYIRRESRKILESHGYLLLAGDICNTSNEFPFEDWYVDGEIANNKIIEKFEINRHYNKTSDQYLML